MRSILNYCFVLGLLLLLWLATRKVGAAEQMTWLQHMKTLRAEIKDCVRLTKSNTWSCFKMSSLRVLQTALTADVITLGVGLRLVRMPTTKALEDDGLEKRQDLQHLTWFDQLALTLERSIKTHMLQVNFRQLTDSYMKSLEKGQTSLHEPVGGARHRRQRYNMMITMMFGVTALGAVLVPMGFQFLSVVSGKALLLAKMALLLASINGLKRVANSGVHYGLYHVPGEQYPSYYDRGDLQHPRNVFPSVETPIDFGIRKYD